MKKLFFMVLLALTLSSCQSTIKVPETFQYKEISTPVFNLASWQKIQSKKLPYKFYIEGDGYAFNRYGKATNNSTPKSTMFRNIAFSDPYPNVIYLARPCQYIMSDICSKRHWTTARFAPEIINSTAYAIKEIAKENNVILIGYSGGAQVAGLIATNKPKIKVTKLITIAGNLDHEAWTKHHNVPPLDESMTLNGYKKQYLQIPQIHLVGKNDKIVSPSLTQSFIKDETKVIIIDDASHNKGWEPAYKYIHN